MNITTKDSENKGQVTAKTMATKKEGKNNQKQHNKTKQPPTFLGLNRQTDKGLKHHTALQFFVEGNNMLRQCLVEEKNSIVLCANYEEF